MMISGRFAVSMICGGNTIGLRRKYSTHVNIVIIEHRAMCRMYRSDSKASTVTPYTRFFNGDDVTVLDTWRNVQFIAWWGKSNFNTPMF